MKQLIALFFLITPSLFAQKWNELNFKSIGYIFTATSELDGGQVDDSGINRKYGAVNLFDGNYTTAWVDGVKGNGIGESIYVAIPNDCRTINIFAGYGKSPTIYNSNNRVKRIKLSCYIGINPEGYVTELDFYGYLMQRFPAEYFIDLKDVAELQTFIFPFSLQELKIFQ